MITRDSSAEKQQKNSRGMARGRPFVKGICPNPSGRPRGSVSLSATLKRLLTRAQAEALARRLIALASAGSVPAMKILFDRVDGPVDSPNISAVAVCNPAPPPDDDPGPPRLSKQRLNEILAALDADNPPEGSASEAAPSSG